jgi:type IV pilus biogenesis protein CpaD/CtpE
VEGRTSVTRLLLASLALAAAAAVLVSGCSSTDAIFPAVHDMPAPRPDAPLTADEVKQATDSLITQRDNLTTEVQTPAPPAAAAKTATAATSKAAPPRKRPFVPQAAPQNAAGASTQTAGAEAKP